ncbi:MAG: thioesterase family protein [Lautropia sp.]
MSQFDDETRLSRTADDRFEGRVHAAYNIGTNPNGGYLMAIAVAAVRARVPQHPDPLSVTVHYQRPGAGDEACEVVTEVLRSGRSVSTVRAQLLQQGKPRLDLVAAMGVLPSPEAVAANPSLTIPPPAMPAPDACIARTGAVQGIFIPLLERMDILLHPDESKPASMNEARVSGYARFRDGRAPDTLSALLFADAFPPAVFSLLGLVGWVPTIELTVHVRRRPAPGWVLGRFRVDDLADGRMIEDGALWDSEGTLFARSRQLAMLLKKGE